MIKESTHIKLNRFNQESLNKLLFTSINKGDFEMIKYILESPKLDRHADITASNSLAFQQACSYGDVETIEYLANFLENKNPGKNKKILENGILQACIRDNNEVIECLLSSPNLKEHASPNADNGNILSLSCSSGNLEMVKFLLTNPNLKEKTKINGTKNNGLIEACIFGHFEVIKYLTSSSELKEHADIHTRKDKAFIELCKNEHFEIAKYFIFDLKINYTTEIEKKLKEYPSVKSLFERRELNNCLQKDLPISQPIKKIKI